MSAGDRATKAQARMDPRTHPLDRQHTSWTAEELIFLRDNWIMMDLLDLAAELRRSPMALHAEYHLQRGRPEGERFTPRTDRNQRSRGHDVTQRENVGDTRRRNTYAADPDEGAWWEAGYYK